MAPCKERAWNLCSHRCGPQPFYLVNKISWARWAYKYPMWSTKSKFWLWFFPAFSVSVQYAVSSLSFPLDLQGAVCTRRQLTAVACKLQAPLSYYPFVLLVKWQSLYWFWIVTRGRYEKCVCFRPITWRQWTTWEK